MIRIKKKKTPEEEDTTILGDKQTTDHSKSDNPKIALPMNSNDKVFADIRSNNIESINVILQAQAREVAERYEEFRKNKDIGISEIREFVKGIPGLKQTYESLRQHINIAELVTKTSSSTSFTSLWQMERSMIEGDSMYEKIEDMMGDQDPLMKILRLLCLQSLTSGGLKVKNFDSMRRLLLQTYGYELLLTMNNLERVGLVKRRETLWADSTSFGNSRKALRLINDSVNVNDPGDIAYVTSGYAPLTVRLVEQAMTKEGWIAIPDALKNIPGATGEIAQIKKTEDDVLSVTDDDEKNNAYNAGGEKKVMMVYYLGGVTHMEIAALRFLSKQPDSPYDIIIATTKIINGNSLLTTLIDKEMSGSFKDKL